MGMRRARLRRLRAPARRVAAAVRGAAARRRHPRRQPALGPGLRRASRPRGTGPGADRILDFLGWCEDVGVERVTLWLLSTDNLSRPAGRSSPTCSRSSRTSSGGSPPPAAGGCTRWARSTCCRRRPPGASRSTRTPPAGVEGLHVNVAIGYGGRREIADAVRSLLQEHAAQGTLDRGAGRDPRRRAHRRAPLHPRPARSGPRHPHLGRAAAVRLPALAERPQRVLLLRGAVARLPEGRLPARAAFLLSATPSDSERNCRLRGMTARPSSSRPRRRLLSAA